MFSTINSRNTSQAKIVLVHSTGGKHLVDALLAVDDMHLYAKLVVDMLGQVLRAVDTAVLASCAAEAEHQAGEAALDVAAHVMVGQFIDAIEELQYLAIVFQKADDRRIQSRELLVGLITAWVVRAADRKSCTPVPPMAPCRHTWNRWRGRLAGGLDRYCGLRSCIHLCD